MARIAGVAHGVCLVLGCMPGRVAGGLPSGGSGGRFFDCTRFAYTGLGVYGALCGHGRYNSFFNVAQHGLQVRHNMATGDGDLR